ncbi:MAG: PLP-dependent aminotransferase family protein, partial [Hyphomicrobium sp.]
MSSSAFDFTSLLRPGLPPAAVKFTGFAPFNFIGGHNDAESTPVDGLIEAATTVLKREGKTLATYGLASGPLGYIGLRQFLAKKLKKQAGITCTPDEILITSGSNQGLDLINATLIAPGDTIVIEEASYGGAISRFLRTGAKLAGVALDKEGLIPEALDTTLTDLKAKGEKPKYIYTIPTVQNPTGAIMGPERRAKILEIATRHGVPIVEDECYSDLLWNPERPKAMKAMSTTGNVIFVGSFSKSIAPALRVGYVVADWAILSRMLGCKADAGSGALEQMVLAEFCEKNFDSHVARLNTVLQRKAATLVEALKEQFGTAAEFEIPRGGIYLWIKLPDKVDTLLLNQAALKAGIAFNPGPEWSIDKAWGKSRLRICFA